MFLIDFQKIIIELLLVRLWFKCVVFRCSQVRLGQLSRKGGWGNLKRVP